MEWTDINRSSRFCISRFTNKRPRKKRNVFFLVFYAFLDNEKKNCYIFIWTKCNDYVLGDRNRKGVAK